jgi:hypothetical protein
MSRGEPAGGIYVGLRDSAIGPARHKGSETNWISLGAQFTKTFTESDSV